MFSTGAVKNEKEVFRIVSEIREEHGCHLILNGVPLTLKYYLRLISSKTEFLNIFFKMIITDKELQTNHKKVIKELKNKFFDANL